MKAFIHVGKPGIENTHFTDFEEVEPKKGEVKVRVKTAGLNHRDIGLYTEEARMQRQ